jgi:ribokinase
MARIYNLGSLNIDEVFRVPHFVRPGETLASHDFQRGPGGKGFNQSIALARAGADVAHLGKYHAEAAFLRDLLSREKIDVTGLLETPLPAGRALIQVDDQGQNAILLLAGSNHALSAADLPQLLSPARAGDWFLTQNETNRVDEAIREAAARNLIVAFNPAPMTRAVRDYPLTLVDWLIVNEIEAMELSGEKDPKAIFTGLRRIAPKAHLILTLGAEGVAAEAPDGKRYSARPPLVTPVDTTAAGDIFIGYLLAGIMTGEDIATALDRACRAAALSVTRPGAALSSPYPHELS